jgi:hypothetical protein
MTPKPPKPRAIFNMAGEFHLGKAGKKTISYTVYRSSSETDDQSRVRQLDLLNKSLVGWDPHHPDSPQEPHLVFSPTTNNSRSPGPDTEEWWDNLHNVDFQ